MGWMELVASALRSTAEQPLAVIFTGAALLLLVFSMAYLMLCFPFMGDSARKDVMALFKEVVQLAKVVRGKS